MPALISNYYQQLTEDPVKVDRSSREKQYCEVLETFLRMGVPKLIQLNVMEPENLDFQHSSGETKGSFYLERDGEVKAQITYSKLGTTQIIIDHTEVSVELRGEDIGKKLVKHAIDYAREHDLKVIPLCPFAKSIISRNESMQDVLK